MDWSQAPRLPSPQSPTYQRDPAESADPAVADVAKGLNWDTHLSGGGTAPALTAAKGTAPLSPWELREDVWRAGYPYPLDDVKVFIGTPEAPPPDELLMWLVGVDPQADLGLVRARSALREAWVGLVSRPRVNLGVVPRAVDPGATLTLPALQGGKYRISDADGKVLEGALDEGYRGAFDSQGEWVVQVSDPVGVAAWFPVYVGVSPPLQNLFPPAPTPLGTDQEIADLVERYLAMLRDAYGSAVWRRDTILDASARRLLTDPDANVGSQLRGLGVAEPHFAWSCTALSVEACLDAIVWDPVQRGPLLLPEYTNLGIATAPEGGKVRIRIVLSGG